MRILFICRANAGRSQMAAGFARNHLGVEARSAGVHVGDRDGEAIPNDVVEVMREVGIDLSRMVRTQLDTEAISWAEHIILVAPETEAPPVLLETKFQRWNVTDPRNMPIEVLRATRDEVYKLTEKLLNELSRT